MNILCTNKKATFKYFLLKKFEAGLSLYGWEVKSIKLGHAQISESYITISNNEAYLVNSHLKVLSNISEGDKLNSKRSRKLLLNRRELINLSNEVKQNGYSIVPTKMYAKNSLIKLEIALAKGKKSHDKRADIKDKEWARNKDRILKRK